MRQELNPDVNVVQLVLYHVTYVGLFTGTSRKQFEAMQLVKIGGDLDANNNIINYFHGIIAGLSVLFF